MTDRYKAIRDYIRAHYWGTLELELRRIGAALGKDNTGARAVLTLMIYESQEDCPLPDKDQEARLAALDDLADKAGFSQAEQTALTESTISTLETLYKLNGLPTDEPEN